MSLKKENPPPASSRASEKSPEESASVRHPEELLAEWVAENRVLQGLHRSDDAFIFCSLFEKTPGLYVWFCRDNSEAERVAGDLEFFGRGSGAEVLVLPGLEADPYRGLSPHPQLAEKRSLALWRLLQGHRGFLVTTHYSLLTRMPSPDRFRQHCMHLEIGDERPFEALFSFLRSAGYLREDAVSEMGEYSSRGGILDVFSPAHEKPLRLEFFGNQLESIREFDSATQRSVSLLGECTIVPMREQVIDAEDVARWHREVPRHFGEVRFAPALEEKRQFTSEGMLFNGYEYLLPLVLENESSLFDYIPERQESFVVWADAEESAARLAGFQERLTQRYQELHADGELVLPPDRLFFQAERMLDLVEEHRPYRLQGLGEASQALTLDFRRERKYRGAIRELLADIDQWRQAHEQTVLVMNSLGMAERVRDIFGEYDLPLHLTREGWPEARKYRLVVTEGNVSSGFHSPRLKLHLLTQENLFEERRPVRGTPAPAPASADVRRPFLSDFRDLREGDHVVHIEHGIGRFQGLQKIGQNGGGQEFVELVYQNGDKLYVPIDRLDLLQKFSGAGMSQPSLDRLGGASWERTKKRIRRSVRKLAGDLLKLYAKREISKGHAFSADDEMMTEFEEAFEYDETPDQMRAIQDVKRDMESEKPMDRLVCGDVGYGKTEVAMRAAFKAVNDGFQVAVLAPTTVLAFQHVNTFRERFQGFPVRVDMISRFRTRPEQKKILERNKQGLIDILIGTHRLLSKDVSFRKLGLIIVDEEQRFGVAQKEKLKRLRTQVDVLSMSATPIPRTLNMSLMGVRDLSVIETPPKDRLSIQTVVVPFSSNIITSAIDLELKRKGQVFFVHNSIETIESIAAMVKRAAPQARIAVGHGQMPEKDLEEIMLDFLNYRFDVLVSTTIVENGLDIPRANTLLVNRSDRFGLSQLYQLRGRVGRSHRRAYAYFLIPSPEVLTTKARKRLTAIREFSDLGTGFRIAALDLEIRGAGNLLGAEQHGHINSVGFDLYMKLLENTIRELKGEPIPEEIQTSIDLGVGIQIPPHYIGDAQWRLWLYKRIASVYDPEALDSLREETIDRFGKYPRSVANLFEYAGLRLAATPLRIQSLDLRKQRLLLKFRSDTPIASAGLVSLVGRDSRMSLSPDGLLTVEIGKVSGPPLFALVRDVLEELAMLKSE